MSTPKTVAEWQSYVGGLTDDVLYDVASAANSASFVRQLQSEGYDADDIHAVLHAFASELTARDIVTGGDGLYDWASLARRGV
jgi:hypothetical protein